MFASHDQWVMAVKARLDGHYRELEPGKVFFVPLVDIGAPDGVIDTIIKLYEREGIKAYVQRGCLHVESKD